MAYGTIMGQTPTGGGGAGGKRYADIVIGTSTAGWTAADCDYLCDGTNDQVEFNSALASLTNGGSIFILSGSYNITSQIYISFPAAKILIYGSGTSTELNFNNYDIFWYDLTVTTDSPQLWLKNLRLNKFGGVSVITTGENSFVDVSECAVYDSRMIFQTKKSFITNNYLEQSTITGSVITISEGVGLIQNNNFTVTKLNYFGNLINGAGSTQVSCLENSFYFSGSTPIDCFNQVEVVEGNYFYNFDIAPGTKCMVSNNYITNGSISAFIGSVISSNRLTNGTITAGYGTNVSNNAIINEDTSVDYCISMGKWANNLEDNYYSIVTGNNCIGGNYGIYLRDNSYANRTVKYANISNNTCTQTTPIYISSNWENCLISGNILPNGTITDNGVDNVKVNNITA